MANYFAILTTKAYVLAPRVGLEPTAYRLTAECSTIELPRIDALILSESQMTVYYTKKPGVNEKSIYGVEFRFFRIKMVILFLWLPHVLSKQGLHDVHRFKGILKLGL